MSIKGLKEKRDLDWDQIIVGFILIAAVLFGIGFGTGELGKAIFNIKAKTLYVQVIREEGQGFLAEKVSKRSDKQWIILDIDSNPFKPGDKLKVSGKYESKKGSTYVGDKYDANIPIMKVLQAEVVKVEKEEPSKQQER